METYANYDLDTLLTRIRAFSQSIWNHNKILFQFTDHGINHSERMITFMKSMALMLPPAYRLNEVEVFALYASAYLHDIGMQWGAFTSEYGYNENFDEARRSHVTRSLLMIKHAIDETQLIPNFTLLPMPNFGDPLGDHQRILNLIAPIIKAHSKDEHAQELGWDSIVVLDDVKGQSFRMRLLAAIFRFADELDITYHRVPDHNKLFKAILNPLSLMHWMSCDFFEEVRIHDGQIDIIVNDSKIPTANESLREVAYFIINNSYKKILRSYLKPVSLRHRETIRNIFVTHGLTLCLNDLSIGQYPESTASNDRALSRVQEYIRKGKIPMHVKMYGYKIFGYKTQEESSVREIYLIDERHNPYIPEEVKGTFVIREKEKHLSEKWKHGICFLDYHSPRKGKHYLKIDREPHPTRVRGFNRDGIEKEFPVSNTFAAASHLGQSDESLMQIKTRTDEYLTVESRVFSNKSGTSAPDKCVEISIKIEPDEPFQKEMSTDKYTLLPYTQKWYEVAFVSPTRFNKDRRDVIKAYYMPALGRHLIVPEWQNPDIRGISNFFLGAYSNTFWKSREKVLSSIYKFVANEIPFINPLTVSVLSHRDSFIICTYSKSEMSLLALSGGAIMSAGLFLLDNKSLVPPGTEIDLKEDEVDICTWFNTEEYFLIRRQDASRIGLVARVHVISQAEVISNEKP